jgi:hypothetical protein
MRDVAVLTCVLAAFLLGTPAVAREGGSDPMQACRADFERFCKDVKPGDGRQIACMVSNQDRLSGDCAKLIREKAQKEAEWKERKAGKGK